MMTGKKEKNKTCPLCGGELHDGRSAIPFFIGNRIIVVRDVPAEVCSDCGEAYMKSSVAGNVEKLLDALEGLHAEMSVVQYKVA
jgi:YgiT-type zinc finger domain-containing protein